MDQMRQTCLDPLCDAGPALWSGLVLMPRSTLFTVEKAFYQSLRLPLRHREGILPWLSKNHSVFPQQQPAALRLMSRLAVPAFLKAGAGREDTPTA
ncbi:unnamed protein product [Arctogadus glacialis]